MWSPYQRYCIMYLNIMEQNELLVIKALIHSPSKHFPLNNTFCSSLNFVISSLDVKLSSRDTALDFNIFFGTRAVIKTVAYTN